MTSKFKKLIKKKLIKESIWSIMNKWITMVLFLILNIYLARVLWVESFWQWSYFLSIITILFTISYMGINNATKAFVGRNSKNKNLASILEAGIRLRLIVSIIFAILLLFLMPYLVNILWENKYKSFFMISILFIFFKTFLHFIKNVFQALHRVKYVFLINMLEFSFYLIFVFFFLQQSLNIIYILYSFLWANIIAVVFGFCALNEFYKKENTNKQEIKKYMKRIFKYSLPLIVMAFWFLLMTEIDTFMIWYIIGNKEAGIYSASKQIINKLPHIAMAISIWILPIFARLNKKNVAKLKKTFNKLLVVNLTIYGFILLFIFLFAWFIINTLYGLNYQDSSIILQILAFGAFLWSFNIYFNGFLNYQMKSRKRAKYIVITIIINILLNLYLIPKYGAIWAAYATALSNIPFVFLNYMEVKKTFREFET